MKSFGLLAAAGVAVLRLKPSRTAFLAATGIFLAGVTRTYADFTFTTLTPPAPINVTFGARAISGNTIVGSYYAGGIGDAGFIETGGVYSTVEDPLSTTTPPSTVVCGVSGNTVVGYYGTPFGSRGATSYNGFSETGGTYTSLTDPAAVASGDTWAMGIFGDTIVGIYSPLEGTHGFIESGGVYKNFDVPGSLAATTRALGVYANTVVGDYETSDGQLHGFIYDSTKLATDPAAWGTLNDPLATSAGTEAEGISGRTIVGTYFTYPAGGPLTPHGFVETGGVFTTVDDPLNAQGTYVFGIDGTTIVGEYLTSTGSGQGFVATLNIPEPASLSLLVLGSLTLLAARRRSSRDIRHGSVAP